MFLKKGIEKYNEHYESSISFVFFLDSGGFAVYRTMYSLQYSSKSGEERASAIDVVVGETGYLLDL